MVKKGVIHGRFQVLHFKHMEYLLAAKMKCQRLYIGISNPDISFIEDDKNDPHRSMASANPFTYIERYEMIHDAMLEFGVPRSEFEIVPFPINRPEFILQYAPKDATYFMSINDAWGEEKLKILEGLGVKVDVLWRRPTEEKGTSSSEVRDLIVRSKDWSSLVPKSVYNYMMDHKLDRRIRKMAKEEKKGLEKI